MLESLTPLCSSAKKSKKQKAVKLMSLHLQEKKKKNLIRSPGVIVGAEVQFVVAFKFMHLSCYLPLRGRLQHSNKIIKTLPFKEL